MITHSTFFLFSKDGVDTPIGNIATIFFELGKFCEKAYMRGRTCIVIRIEYTQVNQTKLSLLCKKYYLDMFMKVTEGE